MEGQRENIFPPFLLGGLQLDEAEIQSYQTLEPRQACNEVQFL